MTVQMMKKKTVKGGIKYMYETTGLEIFLYILVMIPTCIGILYLGSKIPDNFMNPEAIKAKKEGKRFYYDKFGEMRDVEYGRLITYGSGGGKDVGIYYYNQPPYGVCWDAQLDKLNAKNAELPGDCPYCYEFARSTGSVFPANRYIMKFDKEKKLPYNITCSEGYIKMYYNPKDCTGYPIEKQKITREEAKRWGYEH